MHSLEKFAICIPNFVATNILINNLRWNGKPIAGTEGQEGLFASAVYDKKSNQIIIKIVNTSEKEQHIDIRLNGLSKMIHAATLTTYKADNTDDENTLDDPTKLVPQSVDFRLGAPTLDVTIAAKSFAMYKIER